jgi:RNA-directed DNA polymerase
MPVEQRTLTSGTLLKMERGGRLAMSLETPEKIRNLQKKLYCKAKAEPAFRFYVLYDKICRKDILLHAYRLARANAGAPGVDGVTFAQIEEAGLEAWLAGLREELVRPAGSPDPFAARAHRTSCGSGVLATY